ncbi:MAG: type IV secretion system protein [Actinomycetaceae bacterium]|nr:type IV secretion system protein [Actinomycetaceae bacterium]
MRFPTFDITIPGLEDIVKAMLNHIRSSNGVDPYDVSAAASAVPGIAAGVQVISMTILSIMALVEFTSAIARYGGDTSMGAKVISFTMFKIFLLVTIAKKGTDIANGIIQEGHNLLAKVTQSAAAPGGSMDTSAADVLVENASTGQLLGAIILLMIPWLLAWVPWIATKVVLAVVELQLYLLAAFAALPLAFLTNSETRSIAVSYMKKLFALAITPVVVYAMIALYNKLVAPAPLTGQDSLVGWLGDNFIDLIAAPVLLTVLVVSSSSLAGKVLGD